MNTIASDNPFSKEETETLATLVGMMIPASTKYDVPGADDDTILTEIISTARQNSETIVEGLKALEAEAQREHNAPFPGLTHDVRMSIVEQFQETSQRLMANITAITVQCYYRDPRVMESLGMEARPPYPEGFELEQGDWSLLDPVRDRGKIWRDVTG